MATIHQWGGLMAKATDQRMEKYTKVDGRKDAASNDRLLLQSTSPVPSPTPGNRPSDHSEIAAGRSASHEQYDDEVQRDVYSSGLR